MTRQPAGVAHQAQFVSAVPELGQSDAYASTFGIAISDETQTDGATESSSMDLTGSSM
jgi:hypothetical protein